MKTRIVRRNHEHMNTWQEDPESIAASAVRASCFLTSKDPSMSPSDSPARRYPKLHFNNHTRANERNFPRSTSHGRDFKSTARSTLLL